MSLGDRAAQAHRDAQNRPVVDKRREYFEDVVEPTIQAVIDAWCERMGVPSVTATSIPYEEIGHSYDDDYYFAYGYFETEGRKYQVQIPFTFSLKLMGPSFDREPLLPNCDSRVRIEIYRKYGTGPHASTSAGWEEAHTLEELGAALAKEKERS
jgi:hypothetical protein